jgi:hypothetical protein
MYDTIRLERELYLYKSPHIMSAHVTILSCAYLYVYANTRSLVLASNYILIDMHYIVTIIKFSRL